MLLFPLTFISDTMAVVTIIIMYGVSCIQGLIPLYIALYYVKHVEGTVDAEELLRKQSRAINVEDPLFIFIENYENYKLLKEYMSHCWSLENLLFYQKASIMYRIVLKCKNMCAQNAETSDVYAGKSGYRNKFEFLSLIYAQYESKISGINEKQLEFDDIKLNLYNIEQEIFEEFIKPGSPMEINLPFFIKRKLITIFENDEKVNQFQSFDDFLHLFDDAIINIYQLITSMYQYKFVEYVK
eukprot:310040_1